MPFVAPSPGEDMGERATGLRVGVPPAPRQSWGDWLAGPPFDQTEATINAAFRHSNPITSALNYAMERSGFVDDPFHNPLDIIRNTPYEANHLQNFVGSRSVAETRAIMARLDREDADRALLDSAGFPGMVAQVVAGSLDPTIFIPAGTIYRGVSRGRAAVQSALTGAASGTAMMAGQEAILYGTQETRTLGESTMAVASGAILSGILGGAISALSRREFGHLADQLSGLRRDISEELATGVPPVATGAGAQAAHRQGGAVLSDAPSLTLKGTMGATRALSETSPVTRLQTSNFREYRAGIRDLGDGGLSYVENLSGVPTSAGGTVETRVRMRQGPLVTSLRQSDELYAQYWFQQETAASLFQRKTAGMRATWASWTGRLGGRMTRDEWNEQVSKAMRRSDTHPEPTVQQMAQIARSDVIEPAKEAAIKVGLLPEGVKVRFAESYLTRVFNRTRIRAERDRWNNLLVREFLKKKQAATEGFEAAKAGRISRLERELEDLETPATDRPATAERLETELTQLRADNAQHVALDERLKELRTRATAAGKAKNADEVAAIKQAIRDAREEGGDAYRAFVSARTHIAARLKRMRQAGTDAGDATVARRAAEEAQNLRDRVRNIHAERGDDFVSMLDADVRGLVDDVTNAILGESILRLPGLSLMKGPKGPMRERMLNIADDLIEDFLENDIEKVLRSYSTSMWSDIELTAKYGDVNMTQVFTRARQEFNQLANAVQPGPAGDKLRTRLAKQFKSDTSDLEALRDRIRGMYRMPDDPDALGYRAAKVALNANYVARLGGAGISQLTDFARPIMRYGLDTFRDGWLPLISNLGAAKMANRELRLAGTALEMERDHYSMVIADLLDNYGRNTGFERGLQALADRFSMVNLVAPLTATSKSVTGRVAMATALRAVSDVAAGKATKKVIDFLAQNGVEDAMARRIWAHVDQVGARRGTVHLPNTEQWRLPGGAPDQEAIDAFRAVVNREVSNLIVTPGLEKPLGLPSLISQPTWQLLSQFKTFNFASTQKTLLAGLQQRDARIMVGAVNALALGAMVAWTKNQLRGPNGEDTSTWGQGRWVAEALDNSGLLGILSEANAITEKVSQGRLGMAAFSGRPVSRYSSRNAVGALLGPTADAAADALTVARVIGPGMDAVTGSAAPSDQRWRASDTHALRKIVPLSNLFYLRQLFDQVEQGVNNQFGIPPARPPRRPH